MHPAICSGDALTVRFFPEPLQVTAVPLGQVVLIKDEKEWVAHRVVRQGEKICSKGDWSPVFDDNPLAWGQVTAINGGNEKLCRSPLIARISSWDRWPSGRWARWLRKLILWGTVLLLRGSKRRRNNV